MMRERSRSARVPQAPLLNPPLLRKVIFEARLGERRNLSLAQKFFTKTPENKNEDLCATCFV